MKKAEYFGLALLLVLVTGMISCNEQPDFPVEYSVRVRNVWSVNSHPVDYPQTAHISPFLVFSHKPGTQAYVVGLPATDGVKQMAETGSLTLLYEEVDIFRGGDRALDRSTGNDLVFLQTSTVRLGFNDDHHQLTFLAHIGPSPDWFLSLKALDMKDSEGWIDSMRVYPTVFDAGTDNGTTYNSPDFPQEPRNTVQPFTGSPLASNGSIPPLVEVTIVRLK